MKARQAKKILFDPNKYWSERIIRAAIDYKDDHRVINALRICHRKRRRKGVSYE